MISGLFLRLRWVCFLLLGLAASVQAADATPHQVVETAANDLLALIEKGQAYAEQEPERFYTEVESLLRPVVDFSSFARSVMAVNYKRATPEQRERFAETFKWGLVRTYALALTEFKGGDLKLLPQDTAPKNPKRQSVKMEIKTSGGEIYPIVYSMALNKSDEWRMRNIIINGVNIGLTYRSQFASAVKDKKYGGDLDKVIEAWAKVVADKPATS